MSVPRLPLALTLGDPAGVGPEIVARALAAQPHDGESATPVRVFGPRSVLEEALARFAPEVAAFDCVDTGPVGPWRPGEPSQASGKAALEAIEAAVEACQRGRCAALVTAPISKTALRLAGCPFPGHTELLAKLCGVEEVAMMFASERLHVVLATIHLALAEAIGALTCERVERAIRFAHAAGPWVSADPSRAARPRIAVAGLNPHAGEGGLFGREEIEVIAPAIERCRARGIDASGPWPPDTVFMRARRGEFDLVVAMTHDHGLIAVKLDGWEQAVNITLGLPFLRTSVDHGTAYDIAWQGRACAENLKHVLAWTSARLPQHSTAAVSCRKLP
ncbi:MAG: 4-hydroxythreonine-4-phosphate dehydrogenase PdxA [Casimicrobiaceae bacterium]|nr:4-hydroxythreonine-4-phosphate dehydrogenase PdxA [Casimicrobiaceae bacterium]MDW8313137.1 4-hydroxythreonine-4-phosphate dehydrogenase PdxA [Burkholderiales bacterium]